MSTHVRSSIFMLLVRFIFMLVKVSLILESLTPVPPGTLIICDTAQVFLQLKHISSLCLICQQVNLKSLL